MHVIQAHHLKISSREFCSWEAIKGYQLKYIYFIDKKKEKDLTVPILPFTKIDEIGAGMYKGDKISLLDRRVSSSGSFGVQPEKGGANPTRTLQKGMNNV